ncbi:hypothetical protein F511_05778 [Dorcoceras hygrometricum]|uniref:Uncharacterized protein n=1 Tax=Dorcoceras hygrometricum TaxID=472368 RepID=A0A2Z7B2S0_9LAMI|nr:hypothetical protein F511_05778 [Dorcoceras hygrometricum]
MRKPRLGQAEGPTETPAEEPARLRKPARRNQLGRPAQENQLWESSLELSTSAYLHRSVQEQFKSSSREIQEQFKSGSRSAQEQLKTSAGQLKSKPAQNVSN